MARWHSCNVLNPDGPTQQLWQFAAKGDKLQLQREEAKQPTELLSQNLVGKDWQALFQPKLNIAWFPADKVFLRVVQLPKSDLEETQSMLDLQLEKISPLPVAQVVWGFELLPHQEVGMQTVIVIIVARGHVEEFLGRLEGSGYLADRLELPFIDQLCAANPQHDGIRIYPGSAANHYSSLVAWWFGGTLRNLSLLHLPPDAHRQSRLQELLAHMNWAGELEGWLAASPNYLLVADETLAVEWLPLFEPGQNVEVLPPASPAELAALTASRATSENRKTNLLPPEYAERYRQRFVERLWMRALGAVVILYLAGVFVYLGLVQYAKWRQHGLEKQMATVGIQYTNTIQLRERVRVMQDQVDLQFAALDSYNAVAENLPPELTLDTMTFERGRKLTLFGTGGSEDFPKVQEFNEKLAKVQARKLPLFSKVGPPNNSQKPGGQMSWNFSCDLKRTDNE